MSPVRAFSLILLATLAGTAAPACGGSSSPSQDGTPNALSGTIGPQGGVLAGKPGTAFEGFRLEVPAGAIASSVDVQVTPMLSDDDVPLPDLAERVGLAFDIEPATSLATPAHLSLPVNAPLVQRFGSAASDVKVWVKSAGAWSKVDQTGSADGSVTIDLPALGPAAAGVKLATGVDFCANIATCVREQYVVSSLGFPSLVGLRPQTAFGFATDGLSLYFGYYDKLGKAHIGEYFFNNQSVLPSQGLDGTTGADGFPYSADLVLAADGSVWTPLGPMGHAQFSFPRDVVNLFPLIDSNDSAIGVARTANDSIVLLSTGGRRTLTTSHESALAAWPTSIPKPTIAPTGAFVADPSSPTGYWAPFELKEVDRFDAVDTASLGARIIPVADDIGTAPSLASAPDGSLAVIDSLHNVLLSRGQASVLASVPGIAQVRDLSFDASGSLWMTAAGSTQVIVLDTAGVIHVVQLAATQLPIGIRTVADGAIVMTSAREVVHIVRQ